MLKVETFSNAIEAQRCLNALNRIESLLMISWPNELLEIGRHHADIAEVTDSIVTCLRDAWSDSAAPTARSNLTDALDRFESR